MKSLNNIKAIIFDFDGTLVDTERLYTKYYPFVFKEFNLKITKQQILDLRSAGKPYREKLFKKWFKIKYPKKIIEQIEVRVHEYFQKYKNQTPIVAKKNCKKVLDCLSKTKLPLIIATSTEYNIVNKLTTKFNIRKYFKFIISSNILKRGKPYPDVYKYVCKQLNLKPKYCIAIEDCPNGVISACKAGCQTIMIPDLTKPSKEFRNKYKFITINSLSELPKLLIKKK